MFCSRSCILWVIVPSSGGGGGGVGWCVSGRALILIFFVYLLGALSYFFILFFRRSTVYGTFLLARFAAVHRCAWVCNQTQAVHRIESERYLCYHRWPGKGVPTG
jgi:hypothetical protein